MTAYDRPDLSGLALLALDGRLDVRQVLLRVQTDLLVSAPARDARALEDFETLALGLLPAADDATAARIARKLAPLPDAPAAVLLLLKQRGGEARRSIAELSPRLDPDLLDEALSGDLELAEAIASRADLGSRMVERLVGLADDAVDFALATNRSLVLPDAALETLAARARGSAALAQALLERSDLTVADEAGLYCHANPERRGRIRLAVEAVGAARRRPGLPRADESDCLTLEALAIRSDREGFLVHLAGCLGLDSALDWRIDHPARHDLLALALVAAGVPSETAIRIFLLLDPRIGRSIEAVFALAALARSVPRHAAAFLVEAILGRPVGSRRAGRHVPVMQGAWGPEGAAERLPARDPVRRSGTAG